MIIDPVTLQARITQAEEAYHRLRTGALREKIDHNGTSITYTRADADKLKGYIAEMQADLAETATPPQRRRALRQVFDYR